MFLFLDPLKMIREIRGLGGFIGTWGGLLNIPQIIGGLLFIRSIEGQVILVTAIFTLVVAGQIHKRAKFSRIIGICHLPWLAMLPWLIWRLIAFDQGPFITLWLVYVAVTVAISLWFDVFDVRKFLKGDKVFAWAK